MYASDNYLKECNYINVERIVVTYIEHENTQTKETLGGSSETIYTYRSEESQRPHIFNKKGVHYNRR
jgi:hypothetical protein